TGREPAVDLRIGDGEQIDTVALGQVRTERTTHPVGEHALDGGATAHAGGVAQVLDLHLARLQERSDRAVARGHRHRIGLLLELRDGAGREAVVMGDERATDRPSDDLRVAALLEQASGEAQAHDVETELLELRALDLVARLLAAANTVVVPVDVLLLGVGEALDRVVDVREVRAEGATDAATGDPDLGEAEQAVAGLDLQQVVQSLRGSAPATGRDQGVALETLLAGGPLHDLVDVREVGVAADEVLTERLADAHHGHLLPHVLSALSGGTVGGLVEPAQATLDDRRRTEPVQAGARGEAGAL